MYKNAKKDKEEVACRSLMHGDWLCQCECKAAIRRPAATFHLLYFGPVVFWSLGEFLAIQIWSSRTANVQKQNLFFQPTKIILHSDIGWCLMACFLKNGWNFTEAKRFNRWILERVWPPLQLHPSTSLCTIALYSRTPDGRGELSLPG